MARFRPDNALKVDFSQQYFQYFRPYLTGFEQYSGISTKQYLTDFNQYYGPSLLKGFQTYPTPTTSPVDAGLTESGQQSGSTWRSRIHGRVDFGSRLRHLVFFNLWGPVAAPRVKLTRATYLDIVDSLDSSYPGGWPRWTSRLLTWLLPASLRVTSA